MAVPFLRHYRITHAMTPMQFTRRDLLKAGLGATALAVAPQPLLARFGSRWEPAPPIDDPHVKALALRGVEAARAAGAVYADVRLTHTRRRGFSPTGTASDTEAMTVGVRALVDGYWGFASSPVWDIDELVRLGRVAVHLARVNAGQKPRAVELAPAPHVQDGHWTMPVELDPFEISPFEIGDYLASLMVFGERFPDFRVSDIRYACRTQEKAFASSDGSYCTQRLYLSRGNLRVDLLENGRPKWARVLDTLTPAGVGWELFAGQTIHEQILRLMEELKEDAKLPAKPVDVGRYDVICDAQTVAKLLDQTLGTATQLDRALGYEANAGGTSYLTDPLAMLGNYQAGGPLVTVTANRRQLGGAATVQWDDDGVIPDEFVLVKGGVLADFQTMRESAGWLTDAYAKTGQPFRSHGCAAAPSALQAPLTHTPNLVLAPGREARGFEELLAGLDTGLAIKNMELEIDFQAQSGLGTGRVYEVKRGKRVARIAGAGVLFRATELWKALSVLGGTESVRRYGLASTKGEPAQSTYHSVMAPPAGFKQLTVIDQKRKA